MKISLNFLISSLSLIILNVQSIYAQQNSMFDAGEPFGLLSLIDEVIIGESEESHEFIESEPGISSIQDILGRPTRVLSNEGSTGFIGYRLGAHANLVAGQAYVLSVDYPEDEPRTIYVINRGGEYGRGFSTGPTLGDVNQTYTHQNLESIAYPLTGEHQSWKTLFFLHDHFPAQQWIPQGATARPETPENGFMVYFAQPGTWSRGGTKPQAPLSSGIAISRIRLFAVPNPDELNATINYPPNPLPRRHLFWREEMSDGAVHQRNNQLAVQHEVDWFEYKARLMKFLGMNTYAKDLLEFGANQGWDSTIHGGNDWVHQSDSPQRWSTMLDMLGNYDFYVLPMYEYAGSKGDNGLGYQRRARPLRRDPYSGNNVPCEGYTHIWWAERANVDVADPDTLEDLRKILEATIIRHKDKVNFLGAWIRTRNSSMPVSFSDFSLNLFSQETNQASPITRAMLIDDSTLKENYVSWWLAQRKKLLSAVRDILHDALGDQSILLFTAYHEEPGPAVNGGAPVTDNVQVWNDLGYRPLDLSEFIANGGYLQSALTPLGSWDENTCADPIKKRFEWNHSSPRPDPENTRDLEGFLFTYPFNRLFTVSDAAGFDMFRGPAGVAMIRHYSLNEHAMDQQDSQGNQVSPLGYFITDVDRAGPYSMLAEARALAFGDPRYIGYLSGQNYNRGFPQYVRRFNQAFLSLPAVASEMITGGADHPNVVIRSYPTEDHGTWFAIINTGLHSLSQVNISLPGEHHLRDAVTHEQITTNTGSFTVDLYPGEVRSLHTSQEEETMETNDLGVLVPNLDGGAPMIVFDAGLSNDMSSNPENNSNGEANQRDETAMNEDQNDATSQPSNESGGCYTEASQKVSSSFIFYLIVVGLFYNRKAFLYK